MLKCVVCDNKDPRCPACKGFGLFELPGCPNHHVTNDVLDAFKAYKRSRKGVWPVGGGWLDQTLIGLHAIEYFEAEMRRLQQDDTEAE